MAVKGLDVHANCIVDACDVFRDCNHSFLRGWCFGECVDTRSYAFASLADSAAAAGADSVEAHPYYGGGVTDEAPGSLTDAGVGSKAAEDLSAQPAAARLEGVTIVSARAADSRTAVVTLRARSRPPFLPWGILPAEGFTITATGSARMTTTQ